MNHLRPSRRTLLIVALLALLAGPALALASAWGPVWWRWRNAPPGAGFTPAIGTRGGTGPQGTVRTDIAWSHAEGRAWMWSETRPADPDARQVVRRLDATAVPAGVAGMTDDPVRPAPAWSRLHAPPTDTDITRARLMEFGWGWPWTVASWSATPATGVVDAWQPTWSMGGAGTRPLLLPSRIHVRGFIVASLAGTAVATPILLAAAMPLVAVAAWRRKRRTGVDGGASCDRCGYTLRDAAVCPECGAEAADANARADADADTSPATT